MCISECCQRLCAGVLCCVLGVFVPVAWSEDSRFEHNHAVAPAGAHVHGEASMQVSLLGSSLDIRLVIPAMDILGYEHAPHTEAEQARFKAALEWLEHPGSWIDLVAEARCKLQSHKLEHPYQASAQHAVEGAHHHTKTAHTDFALDVNWQCANTGQLGSLTLMLFKQFPRIQQVNVDWINDANAGIARLSANEPRLFLRVSQ